MSSSTKAAMCCQLIVKPFLYFLFQTPRCCTKRPSQSSTEQPGWLSDGKSCVGCVSPRCCRYYSKCYCGTTATCVDNQSQTSRRRRKSGCMRFIIVQYQPSMFFIIILAYPVDISAFNCCFPCTFLTLPAPMTFLLRSLR